MNSVPFIAEICSLVKSHSACNDSACNNQRLSQVKKVNTDSSKDKKTGIHHNQKERKSVCLYRCTYIYI